MSPSSQPMRSWGSVSRKSQVTVGGMSRLARRYDDWLMRDDGMSYMYQYTVCAHIPNYDMCGRLKHGHVQSPTRICNIQSDTTNEWYGMICMNCSDMHSCYVGIAQSHCIDTPNPMISMLVMMINSVILLIRDHVIMQRSLRTWRDKIFTATLPSGIWW